MSTIRQDLDALDVLVWRSQVRGYKYSEALSRLRAKIIRRFEAIDGALKIQLRANKVLEAENARLKTMYAVAKKQELLPCDCNHDADCKRCNGTGHYYADLTEIDETAKRLKELEAENERMRAYQEALWTFSQGYANPTTYTDSK